VRSPSSGGFLFSKSIGLFGWGRNQLQRLFSTFANGLPGKGLLLLRLITGASLLYIEYLEVTRQSEAPQLLYALAFARVAAGLLLIIGLWTPVAGTAIAALEVWSAFSGGDLLISIILAALGAGLAMIGPGAWSIDARLFGRKHLSS
jgi:putative oxidoreductase